MGRVNSTCQNTFENGQFYSLLLTWVRITLRYSLDWSSSVTLRYSLDWSSSVRVKGKHEDFILKKK